MDEIQIRIANKLKQHMEDKNKEKVLFYVSAYVGSLGSTVKLAGAPAKLWEFISWYLTKVRVANPTGTILWIGFNEDFGYTSKRAYELCKTTLDWETTVLDASALSFNWS